MRLAVDHLSFGYGSHPILQDVSFSLGDSEVVAVLGPNGVGKSTLFRCLLGFLHGYSGQVLVEGQNAATMPSKQLARHIAYIPQVSVPVFDYTVMELVLMGMANQLKPLQSPGAPEEAKAQAVLDGLGIGHLAHRGCGQISGGEYQLALLARALLQEAPLLVMDEPTANLDFGNQFRIMAKVESLAQAGYSVMLSTHDPNQVLRHCTRVLVVEGGRLLADGAPGEVMTPQLLSRLYGIDVRRTQVSDESGPVALCYPSHENNGPRPAGAAPGEEGNER